MKTPSSVSNLANLGVFIRSHSAHPLSAEAFILFSSDPIARSSGSSIAVLVATTAAVAAAVAVVFAAIIVVLLLQGKG